MMRVELFGTLQIHCGGEALTSVNTNRLRSLLAYLILHGGGPQPREHLAFILWPESNEQQARTNLRQLIHHLRRAIPPEFCFLAADNHTVQWERRAECSIDVLEFESAISTGHLERAAAFYQDDLLRGLYDDWLVPKREHYRQQFTQVLSGLTKARETASDLAGAIAAAERLVAHDPLRESHYLTLIGLHDRNNDRASAIRAYHQCMKILRRELAVEPGTATKALFERILKSEAAVSVPKPAPEPARAHPLIGRNGERQQLHSCWSNASDGGVYMAVILGEPGIGKSRLAEEIFAQYASQGIAAARSRCYAAQGQVAYAPVAEWLRSQAALAGCRKLRRAQMEEVARVLPEILADAGELARPHPLTESWERQYFFEALHAAFGATSKPLLLFIDDLQWCDQDSLEWLQSFFRSPAASRTLVLATARPEEMGRLHPFTRLLAELRRAGQVTELLLEPLGADATAELAKNIAGRFLPPGELQDIFDSTQGNPLFVVESIRAGVAAPKIQAVISARLAQLSTEAYELAGLGGAIGQPFSVELLLKATDWDEASVARALDELWQRRIVEPKAQHYDFTHDRLREVAYAELGPVRRRFLHRRIARALEELHAADPGVADGQMASHYASAGMADEAIRHYRAAATVARARFADEEAATLLRRALTLCFDLPETPRREGLELELSLMLGPALASTQGYSMPEVGKTYARALTLARVRNQAADLLPSLAGCWVFDIVNGRVRQAMGHGEELLGCAQGELANEMTLAGRFFVGSCQFHLSDFEDARRNMEWVLQRHQGRYYPSLTLFAGPDIEVFCRSYLSHVLWHLGLAEQAEEQIGLSILAAGRLGHPFSLAIALIYRALLHAFRHESRRALTTADQAGQVCHLHDFAYYRSVAEIVAGWGTALEEEPDAGIARLRAGLDAMKATGAQLRLPFYYAKLAECYGHAGRPGDALAQLATGLGYQNSNGELWAAPELQRVQRTVLKIV